MRVKEHMNIKTSSPKVIEHLVSLKLNEYAHDLSQESPSLINISILFDIARTHQMIGGDRVHRHHFGFTLKTLKFFEDNFPISSKEIFGEAFWDTKDFDLMKNDFWLRSRVPYHNTWSLKYGVSNTRYGNSCYEVNDVNEILDIINPYLQTPLTELDTLYNGELLKSHISFMTRRLTFECGGSSVYFDLSDIHRYIYPIGTVICRDSLDLSILDIIYTSDLELKYPVPSKAIFRFKLKEIPENIIKEIALEENPFPQFDEIKDAPCDDSSDFDFGDYDENDLQELDQEYFGKYWSKTSYNQLT
jgi:hypothetical protein